MTYLSNHISIPEILQWEKSVNELRMENTRLKDELSAAIRQTVSLDFVERAEYFLQRFIEEDQLIQLLRYDLKRILKQLLAKEHQPNAGRPYVLLEKDISQLATEFDTLKKSFLQFLAGSDQH